MHGEKIWGPLSGAASFASFVGATIWAQLNTLDLTASVGYISGVGLAILALYAKYRDERRKQDTADRESRRHDCEDKLAEVLCQLSEVKQQNGTLRADLDRYRGWLDDRSQKPKEPPCKS